MQIVLRGIGLHHLRPFDVPIPNHTSVNIGLQYFYQESETEFGSADFFTNPSAYKILASVTTLDRRRRSLIVAGQ